MTDYLYKEKRDISVSFKAGEAGIEPTLTVLETAELPLFYSPICNNQTRAQYKTRIYIFCIRSRCTSLCTNWAIFILLSSMPDSNQHLWYTKPIFSTFELMEHLYGWRDSNSYWTGFKPDAIFQLGYTRISLSSQTESNWHFIHTKDMYSTFILWEHLLLFVSPSGIEPLSKT